MKALVKRPWGVHAVVDGKVVERSFWWGRGFVDFAVKYAGVMSTWWRAPNPRRVKPLHDESGWFIGKSSLWSFFKRDWSGSAPARVVRRDCGVVRGHWPAAFFCLVCAISFYTAYLHFEVRTLWAVTTLLCFKSLFFAFRGRRVVEFFGFRLGLDGERIFYQDIKSVRVRPHWMWVRVCVVHADGEDVVSLDPWHFLLFVRGINQEVASSSQRRLEMLVTTEEGV